MKETKVKMFLNKAGCMCSEHVCEYCGITFSVTPACKNPDDWKGCLGEDCESYDKKRTVDLGNLHSKKI